VGAFAACTSIDCPLNHSVYHTYLMKKPDGTPDTLLNDSLWILTRRADDTLTVVLNGLSGTSASWFDLPTSYMAPEDTFFVYLKDKEGNIMPDTIWVKKENYPHFESVDCQPSYFHHITGVRVAGNIIDSIVIINPNTTYDTSIEDFHIYFSPDL